MIDQQPEATFSLAEIVKGAAAAVVAGLVSLVGYFLRDHNAALKAQASEAQGRYESQQAQLSDLREAQARLQERDEASQRTVELIQNELAAMRREMNTLPSRTVELLMARERRPS